jgi:hypothetical protein
MTCRQATKRLILNALGVPWDMRNEYFGPLIRSVRPMVRREQDIA